MEIKIPCLDYLLTLKRIVAKKAKRVRFFKNLQDIEMLGLKNHLSLEKTHYRKRFDLLEA